MFTLIHSSVPTSGWILCAIKVLHPTGQPSFATKPPLVFLLTVLTFGKPLKGTFMSRGWLSPTSLSSSKLSDASRKPFLLIIIYHESPHVRGFFMSNHSSYLCLGWIFYIIYYVSRLFLMNLGDSFGISIFAAESSRFAPKISASHFFMVSERWNCNVWEWFIMRISNKIWCVLMENVGFYYINIKWWWADEQQMMMGIGSLEYTG